MSEKRAVDNVFTKGDGGQPVWVIQKDSSGAIGTDMTYVPLQVNASGQLRTEAAVSLAANSSVNVNQIGGVAVATAAGGTQAVGLIAGTNEIGKVTIVSAANALSVTASNLDIRDLTQASDSVLVYGTDDGGTTKRAIKTDAGGAIQIDVESMPAITGTVTATATISSMPSITGLVTASATITSMPAITGLVTASATISSMPAITGTVTATANAGTGTFLVDISQVGGVTTVTAAAGTIKVGSNLFQVGGNTAATGGTGILQVASNTNQIGGVTLATGAAGTQAVSIRLGATELATGAGGTISFNQQLQAGQAIATGGTGIQSVAIRLGATELATAAGGTISVNKQLIAGQAIATGGTGIQSVGIRLGATELTTASGGVLKVQAVSVPDVANIFSSGLAKKPVFLQISASASGSNLLVASAASTSYLILAYNLMSNGAVNAQLLSSATPMGGITYMPTAGVGKVAPFCPVGWMQTTAGHSLNLNLSASIAVGGEIVYIAI